MTSVSSRPVARLSSPGDIIATVPLLCGFLPADSVVVLSLRGPTRRLGLTIRLDLPPPAGFEEAAQLLADRVVQDGGAAAVVVVYAAERAEALVEAVLWACEQSGVRVVEALHVAGGSWTSYVCTRACCPVDGTPVGRAPSLVQAEHALTGRAVLSDREELVRSLAPPDDPQARARLAAAPRLPAEVAVQQAAAALDLVTAGAQVDADAAACIAMALHDVRVRDEVATWGLERSDALLALCEQVARQVVRPYDAPVCTVLAWIAYSRGDGARANVALDRALRSDPQYSLALLLQAALDGALPPAEVRRTMRATARALRRR